MDPAELRLGILAPPDSLTCNYLKIGTIGLGECIERVVDKSDWKEQTPQTPGRTGCGPGLRRIHERGWHRHLLE